jgi:hypothetical protein
MPTPASLSRSSCLSQLLNENGSNMSSCRVTPSEKSDSDSDVMRIDDGIWLLNSGEHTQHCKLYSNSNDSAESMSITEPTVFIAPCDRKLICLDTQISSSQCTRLRVTTTPRLSPRVPQENRFLLPTSEMRRTIVASHKFQTERVIQNLASAVSLKKPRLLRIVQDFLSYILSLVAFIVIFIISLIKFSRTTLQREIHSLESLVQDILTP